MSLTKIDNQATSVVNGDETLTDTSKIEMNRQTQEAPITVEAAPDARPNFFDEVYGVPCRIGAFVAQTSDTSGLIGARLNWTTFSTCNPVARLFADYRFARFDIDVTLSFTGNPMASGTYLAAIMPEYNQIPNTCNVLGNNFTPTSWLRKLIALPHTLIQVNRNTAFRWRIPFSLLPGISFLERPHNSGPLGKSGHCVPSSFCHPNWRPIFDLWRSLHVPCQYQCFRADTFVNPRLR